ncbi:MAG: efflux RND transporter periplasmic adaptor subunit [Pseudomonadota bacterium]
MLIRTILAAGLALAPLATAAASELIFEGRVEARHQAAVSPGVSGVVTAVLFEGGERVEAGTPLFRIDALSLAADVAEAEAALAAAQADQLLAEQEAARAKALTERGVASDERLETATARLKGAEAARAASEAALERARIDLDRATVRTPLAGVVGRPLVPLGAFVEAEAAPPMATVTQLDEVFVAYAVPYATRLKTLSETGAASLEALFDAITLSLELPGGVIYPQTVSPAFADATVDPGSETITIWAVFPNPDGLLRPGMPVTVRSVIAAEAMKGN